MLDFRCLAVLNALNKECLDGGYKVLEIDDLLSVLPKKFFFDKEGFIDCVSVLIKGEYITVKYQDDTEICLNLTAKGRGVFENRIEREINYSALKRRLIVYAVIGGFTGGAVTAIVSAVISLVTA